MPTFGCVGRSTGRSRLGWQVDHLCHHPDFCTPGRGCLHRRCVSPGHILAVEHRTNLLRSGSIVAVNARKTHCLNDHPLDGPNLYRHPTRNSRHCRACQADRAARWDTQHRATGESATG